MLPSEFPLQLSTFATGHQGNKHNSKATVGHRILWEIHLKS